jgi:quinoprotein dehydrogenase-associated probable ABC transporter substrate-binding protein
VLRDARALLSRALLVVLSLAGVSSAIAEESPRAVFRVCQDPANLPFSNARGEGFENKIAQLLAGKLHLPIEYYNFPQRMGFIRNTLRFKLPGEAYACDVVMGVPANYDQAASTRPYYRSAYALVVGPALAQTESVEDLLALSPEKRAKLRIGVYDRSPASDWLARHGLIEQAVPYRILNADPAHYPGEIIERDLAQSRLDAAIVWGPIGGYFSRRLPSAALRVLPMKSEPNLPLEFDIAIGVRHGDREWRATLDRLIAENRADIEKILTEYNIPIISGEQRQ